MATLVRQSLLPEFETMERRFRRAFEGIPLLPAFFPPSTSLPAVDVYETPTAVVVEVEVPGYDQKELGLELSDHTLTVRGTRAESKQETEKTLRVHERLERHFERTFILPSEIDEEHVTASFEKGVLKVNAPKLVTANTRTVAISS